jgi:hypothetical protein
VRGEEGAKDRLLIHAARHMGGMDVLRAMLASGAVHSDVEHGFHQWMNEGGYAVLKVRGVQIFPPIETILATDNQKEAP